MITHCSLFVSRTQQTTNTVTSTTQELISITLCVRHSTLLDSQNYAILPTMAPPKAEAVSNLEAISVVLRHVNAHPGELKGTAAQLEYLQSITAAHAYSYNGYAGGQKVQKTHNEVTLRGVLRGIARNKGKNGAKKTIDDLFMTGSDALDPGYTVNLDLGDPDGAGGNVDEPITVPDDGPSESRTSAEPPEFSPLSNKDGSASKAPQRQAATERDRALSSPRARKKRKSDESSGLETDALLADGTPEHAPKRQRQRTASVASAEGHITQGPSEQRNSQPTRPSHNEQHTTKSPERTGGDNVPAGDREERQAQTNDRLADRAYEPSPAVPDPFGGRARFVGIHDHVVRERTEALHTAIRTTAFRLFEDIKQDASKAAFLATSPNNELTKLFEEAFGSREWKEVAVELQLTRQISAVAFLQCLISAFLLLRIFRKPLPWDRDIDPMGEQDTLTPYITTLMANGGVDFVRVVQEASAVRLEDAAFRKRILQPIAHGLANDMVLVLNEYLQGIAKEAKEAKEDWYISMVRGFTEICDIALLLHGRLMASPDFYYCLWATHGADYDRDTMAVEAEDNNRSGRKVAFTTLLGIACVPSNESYPEMISHEAKVVILEAAGG